MIKIDYQKIGKLQTNTYYIHDNENCIIIDPSVNAPKNIDYISNHNLNVVGILITHAHYDHVLCVGELQEKYQCPVYIHDLEHEELLEPIQIFGPIKCNNNSIKASLISHNDTINTQLGDFKVIHTPGHSSGSVCYLFDANHLFSGDTLFKNAIGRTDLHRSNPSEMQTALKYLFTHFDDMITVYPGHGEFTTIGIEKNHQEYNI